MMRIFITGATGAIGQRLVPQLKERGRELVASVRSTSKAERLRALGAESVVLDLFDRDAVRRAIAAARPDVIVHEATALAAATDYKHFDRTFARTNELRTRATDHLVAAARAEGIHRIVAQSYAGWPYGRTSGQIKTEHDPLDSHPLPAMRETLEAIVHLERAVVDAGGIALRYGSFYGAPDDSMLPLLRKRLFPIVGGGGGIWSMIHLHDAAAATVLAIERGQPGVYNITDDDPAPVREWLPFLAEVVAAPPPRHVPRFLARIIAGEAFVFLMSEAPGASNAKSKRELSWTLHHPTWRSGFLEAYGRAAPGVAPRLDRARAGSQHVGA